MHTIDKSTIPFALHLEVRPEASINEGINDIAVSEKQIECESLRHEWQDFLRPYPLKSLYGAIPVAISVLLPPQLAIISILTRKLLPEFFYNRKSLRPPHMAIAADHVGNYKNPILADCVVNRFKKQLKVYDMMQALICQNNVVPVTWFPTVEVS